MSEAFFTIQDLWVRYVTDHETVYAVNGLSLSLKRGQTLGLVGETGAGKTTTALSIMRLLPPRVSRVDQGNILFNGVSLMDLSEEEMRRVRGEKIAMIYQDPMTSLNPVMTVGDQVQEVLELHKKQSRRALYKRVDELFAMVGIPPDRKKEYPHQFSGGMKQRIVIAMALACEPELLIADEPTTALDVTIQAQVLQMIAKLKDELDTSMLLITHDLGVVAQTCDMVAIMYAGKIIESGTVHDIFHNKDHHPYTEGLFGSIPKLTVESRRLSPIEGLMPDPTNLPDGCAFAGRCPACMPICMAKEPDYCQRASHAIKCHLFTGENRGEAV